MMQLDSHREESNRISFLSGSQDFIIRIANSENSSSPSSTLPSRLSSLLSERSDLYNSFRESVQSHDLGGHETLLLEMVRARKIQDDVIEEKTLDFKDDETSDESQNEACVHGLGMRATDRSISRSRSRFSRISTRRDMDIPSILVYTTDNTLPMPLKIPISQQPTTLKREELPRWSVRKAVCPVCSQKWRDRSSIAKIKNSGLKRSLANEIPSIVAPARLRSSITMAYVPRPNLALIDEEKSISCMRNTSPTWQLTRARRFRFPKLQMPSPEASAPPKVTAPLARKDLDTRVSKFLRN